MDVSDTGKFDGSSFGVTSDLDFCCLKRVCVCVCESVCDAAAAAVMLEQRQFCNVMPGVSSVI